MEAGPVLAVGCFRFLPRSERWPQWHTATAETTTPGMPRASRGLSVRWWCGWDWECVAEQTWSRQSSRGWLHIIRWKQCWLVGKRTQMVDDACALRSASEVESRVTSVPFAALTILNRQQAPLSRLCSRVDHSSGT